MKRGGLRGSGAMAKLGLGIPLILLALAAWIVLTAGISVVRHEAGSEDAFGGLGFTWFVISANIVVLLFVLIHFVGLGIPFLANTHSGMTGLLAVITVLDIFETRDWNNNRKTTPYSTKLGKGVVTAFSGFLALAVLNALLILIVGNHPTHFGHHRGTDADVYQTTNVHTNPTHTHTGPATATATHTAV